MLLSTLNLFERAQIFHIYMQKTNDNGINTKIILRKLIKIRCGSVTPFLELLTHPLTATHSEWCVSRYFFWSPHRTAKNLHFVIKALVHWMSHCAQFLLFG